MRAKKAINIGKQTYLHMENITFWVESDRHKRIRIWVGSEDFQITCEAKDANSKYSNSYYVSEDHFTQIKTDLYNYMGLEME